eukprot:5381715-Pyramimonas_sp.AAC.1
MEGDSQRADTCSSYYNRQSGGGGGSHESQCVVLGGGYGGASKERVKANGVAVVEWARRLGFPPEALR